MLFYANWLFGGYVPINMLYLLLLRYDISKSQKGGCLREFPQAHSSVRDVCGSSRKHALFLKMGIDFVRKTVRSLLDFTNFAPVDDIPLKPKEEAHIFF